MGMIALSEAQPAHLQSFVSTSLCMLTNRSSYLKITIQMQFSLSPQSVWLLPFRSLPHLDVTPEVASSASAGLGAQTAFSSTGSLLVPSRSPAEFLNARLSVWLSMGFNKKTLLLTKKQNQPSQEFPAIEVMNRELTLMFFFRTYPDFGCDDWNWCFW